MEINFLTKEQIDDVLRYFEQRKKELLSISYACCTILLNKRTKEALIAKTKSSNLQLEVLHSSQYNAAFQVFLKRLADGSEDIKELERFRKTVHSDVSNYEQADADLSDYSQNINEANEISSEEISWEMKKVILMTATFNEIFSEICEGLLRLNYVEISEEQDVQNTEESGEIDSLYEDLQNDSFLKLPDNFPKDRLLIFSEVNKITDHFKPVAYDEIPNEVDLSLIERIINDNSKNPIRINPETCKNLQVLKGVYQHLKNVVLKLYSKNNVETFSTIIGLINSRESDFGKCDEIGKNKVKLKERFMLAQKILVTMRNLHNDKLGLEIFACFINNLADMEIFDDFAKYHGYRRIGSFDIVFYALSFSLKNNNIKEAQKMTILKNTFRIVGGAYDSRRACKPMLRFLLDIDLEQYSDNIIRRIFVYFYGALEKVLCDYKELSNKGNKAINDMPLFINTIIKLHKEYKKRFANYNEFMNLLNAVNNLVVNEVELFINDKILNAESLLGCKEKGDAILKILEFSEHFNEIRLDQLFKYFDYGDLIDSIEKIDKKAKKYDEKSKVPNNKYTKNEKERVIENMEMSLAPGLNKKILEVPVEAVIALYEKFGRLNGRITGGIITNTRNRCLKILQKYNKEKDKSNQQK